VRVTTLSTFKICNTYNSFSLGSQFRLSIVKLIINSDQGIDEVLSKGMIVQYKMSETVYCFYHDQIKQASHSLLPEDPKQILLYMGLKLWKVLTSEEFEDSIYTIVNLLRQSIDLVDDKDQRFKIAELFMQAGHKALVSVAFKQSFEYFATARHLLDGECWKSHYSLSLNIYDNYAKAAYCMEDYTSMHECLDEIRKKVACSLHLVPSFLLRIRLHNDNLKYEDAVSSAMCILKELGEEIDTSNQAMTFSKTKKLQDLLSKEKILEMQPMEEPHASVMSIIGNILTSCYFTKPALLVPLCSRMIELTIKHGLSKYSSVAIATLAHTVRGYDSYDLGTFALTLVKKVGAKEIIPLVYIGFYSQIHHLHSRVHDSIKPLLRTFKISVEIGSNHLSRLAANTYCRNAFLCGTNMETFLDDLEDIRKHFPVQTKKFLCIYQVMVNFCDKQRRRSTMIDGEHFTYTSCYSKRESDNDKRSCSIMCCMYAYMFYDYCSASRFIDIARQHTQKTSQGFFESIFLLYDGLISLAFAATANEAKQMHLQNAINNISALKRMAVKCQENYQNKV